MSRSRQRLLFPFEQKLSAYAWLATDPQPWRDLPDQVSMPDAIRAHAEHAMPAFLQEVVSRTIGRSFQHAVIAGSSFSCPYARVGCAVARSACGALTDLGELPAEGCAVRVWLTMRAIEPERLVWSGPAAA